MRYRISEIKLDIRQSQEELPTAVRKKIKKKDMDIHDLKIIKESIDARKKPDIKKVYRVFLQPEASAERSGGEKISGACCRRFRKRSSRRGWIRSCRHVRRTDPCGDGS